uniref:Ubiquitin-like domain-containing protein n=1 Tax=Meloidogyne floridensis TaxID=298350 RepID=A0A915P948_9BILA
MESSKINVIIKDLTNVSITIKDIETNSTVAELKRRIEQANRTPVAEQRLTYAGKQLEDDSKLFCNYSETLQYYNIVKSNIVVDLVLRMIGGKE